MTIKTKDRKARANYKRKIVTLRVELYPTDEDIKLKFERLEEPKAAYVKRLIREDIARADVIPKGEVEKLKHELTIWKQDRFNLYQRLELYEMARQKVAREIFAEIEKNLEDWSKYVDEVGAICDDLAELKKKYLSQECPTCKHFIGCEPSNLGPCDQYEEEVADDGQ